MKINNCRKIILRLPAIHLCDVLKQIHPFATGSAKSKTENFSKITNKVKLANKQLQSKVLLHGFPMSDDT